MKRIWLVMSVAFFFTLTVPVFAEQSPEEVLKAVVKIRALILKVNGKAVEGLADFYRKVWALGNAGVGVTLSLLRGTEIRDITVRSVDRYKFLQQPPQKTIQGPVDKNRGFSSKSS